jgi:formylglycine-generating enzyme required for sulfatase activity
MRLVFAAALLLMLSAAWRAPQPGALRVPISGTALEVELLPLVTADRSGAAPRVWLGRTEVPWEVLDAFVFSRDAGSGPPAADAIARPSKPYISMDRGFGHAGFPAISVSAECAQQCCRWLSAKTGRRFRLPTLAEFQAACAGDNTAALADVAWFAANAGGRTHRVATRAATRGGFHDLRGNAAEWVVAADGNPVLVGGAYNDPAERLGCAAVRAASADWNATDPQIPPSRWWLADAPFAGFRLACEAPPGDDAPTKPAPPSQPSAPGAAP